jgi:ribosomal protein S18 acetylase RimI-like enzyme
MFTIRHYIDDDLDEVIALWYRSWTYAFPNVKHPQPFEQWKFRFQNEYAKQSEVWVAATPDRVVGFLIVNGTEIAQIFVDVNVQRNGIGAALIKQAKQVSSSGLRLTTLQQNIQARQFYEKHGFVAGVTGVNPINGQPNIEYHWSP